MSRNLRFGNLLLSSVLCLFCLGFGKTTLADEVRLKNGDRLTGALVKSDGKSNDVLLTTGIRLTFAK